MFFWANKTLASRLKYEISTISQQKVQSLTWLTLKERVCQHKPTVNCLCKSHHSSTVNLILVCLTDVDENPSCRAESNKHMRARGCGVHSYHIIGFFEDFHVSQLLFFKLAVDNYPQLCAESERLPWGKLNSLLVNQTMRVHKSFRHMWMS